MHLIKTYLFNILLSVILCSCGSTSKIKNANLSSSVPDLSKYDYVIINDFKDAVSKSGNDPVILAAGQDFANRVYLSIISRKSFEKVARNVDSEESALLIDGKINRLEKGNPVLRALVGFGAGSSKFNAIINIKDNKTKEPLGRIDVSKMSWLLGGSIASSQTVESHMDSAASSISGECSKSKKYKQK